MRGGDPGGSGSPHRVSRTRVVDTGATFLRMPKSLIDQLGPPSSDRDPASEDDGRIRELRRLRPGEADGRGRDCEVRVTEVADSCPVLVGFIPLEMLDFVVDPEGPASDRQPGPRRRVDARHVSSRSSMSSLPPELRSMPRGLVISSSWRLLILASPSAAQTVPVPESIRAEGVPPVPAALASALNRYQNIRSASFQDWDDAKGRAMYVTTRFADTPQVHHVALPGAARRQLTFQPERVLSARPRPGHDQFLMAMDEGGAENYQLFLQDRTGGEPRRITDGKSRNIGPRWSPSGELLAWSGNARNGRDMDLYLAAPADPHFQRVLKEVSGQWTVADWSPDESKVVAEEYLSIQESYHPRDRRRHRPGHDHHPPAHRPRAPSPSAASDPRWSKDGKSIYYITDKGSEFRRLARHDLVTGADEVAHRCDPLGRRGVRPERRRDPRRTGGQRGRPRRPPRVPGGDLAGVPDPQAAPGPDLRPQVPRRVARDRLHPRDRPGRVRRLLAGPRPGPPRALDRERDRRARHLGVPRADDRPLPDVRRPDDPRARLSPRRGPLPRPQARADRDPRRPRGAGPAGLPGEAQLPGERAGHRPDHAECPRLLGLRQDLPEARQRHAPRGGRQGHRRPARLDRQAARPRQGPGRR